MRSKNNHTDAIGKPIASRRPQALNEPFEACARAAENGKVGGKAMKVFAWEEALPLPTYLPAEPDKNPMFMEKRVYQGSSGRVYPLPFTDR
ncbi:MAG: hypothetical protein ACREFR_05220, partial [Limisphaerales bacterium]